MGINELVNVLKQKIGKEYVSSPSTNPNKSNDYRVNVKVLCKYFTDKKISQYAESNWTNKNTIKIKDFLNFIITQTNNNNPRGMYHEYMDFVHAYWDIPINDENIPLYNVIKDINIYDKIYPKRKEYFVAWWIKNKIETNNFLKTINPEIKLKYLKQTYQEPIKKGDDRFYDILLKQLNIIIEIQEDSKSHDESYNDLTKESLCAMRGFRIKYFKLEELSRSNIGYLNEFWNGMMEEDEVVEIDTLGIKTNDYGLKSMIVQGLFSILDKSDREMVYKDYLLHNYLISIKTKYDNLSRLVDEYENNGKKYHGKLYKLKNEFNEDLRDKLESVADLDANIIDIGNGECDFIKIMNKWYKESSNTEEYCINPFDNDFRKAFFALCSEKDDLDKFIKLCWYRGYIGLSGNNYYRDSLEYDFNKLRFSWNGLSRLFIDIHKNENKELQELLNESRYRDFIPYIINIMLTIERTYSSITSSIIIHEETRLNLSEQLMELVEKHIHKKILDKHEKENVRLTKELEVTKKELNHYKLQVNKLLRKSNTFIKKIKPKLNANKEIKEQFISVKKDLRELEKLFGYKQNSFTLQFIKGKGIIKELEEFPIIYTGLSNDFVDTKDFDALCNNFKISNSLKNDIYNELTNGLQNFVTQKNLSILCKVKLNKNNISKNNYISITESNNESGNESGNESESDIESDISSISDNEKQIKKSISKSKNIIIKSTKKLDQKNKSNKIIVENESDSETSLNSIYK